MYLLLVWYICSLKFIWFYPFATCRRIVRCCHNIVIIALVEFVVVVVVCEYWRQRRCRFSFYLASAFPLCSKNIWHSFYPIRGICVGIDVGVGMVTLRYTLCVLCLHCAWFSVFPSVLNVCASASTLRTLLSSDTLWLSEANFGAGVCLGVGVNF